MKKEALSPGALTLRRFLRNRLAVTGLGILTFMFLFSFLGGLLTPYRQEQVFYRSELRQKDYAAVTENESYRYTAESADALLHARLTLAVAKGERQFEDRGVSYSLEDLGRDIYAVSADGVSVGVLHKPVFQGEGLNTPALVAALTAYASGADAFVAEGKTYRLTPEGAVLAGEKEVGYISSLVLQTVGQEPLTPGLRDRIFQVIRGQADSFTYEDRTFTLNYDAATRQQLVREETLTQVWDAYAAPSVAHPLGTDKNGMDMLTRLMYGGRVSLVIGFIVVGISALLGVALGGVAGYFGKWVDGVIMRLVDIFYCIPSTPVLIILGAAMDGMRVEPQLRMVLLMLILGFLGWPTVARLVRGQILSLREQEFMTATEACGLRIRRRIFRHLIPNVIPQLIVTCTMSLGSTILTEATLSFLGLGVKFPFASWGNIMNDVANSHVLTSYWFVWVPAGVCLVLSVLGFNFVGDGLRDAYDPKMKR
ncbi:MAG: ABC transporter permease [Oscillospiraceae bacterium]|nr:ABC transporter permease [Oscillospiraceae bacterium]